ncbi:EAL domain-containing response regulator [Bordetella hinzii]|uniref:Diguanylate phosphodiesterase n=3 Tax=Bordetella hinzii TaxID=103855 RepID=A0AAN1RZB9_9BORD|nr:EAL domain-containing response regulator [Bordetella hinzii]AKQ55623.1 Phytochrome-like protein cph2 [Bordetella hinzii]AKQ60125.1 Phytochrome-like protein cph2 [Bordetella hinzii]AZW18789.1 diguanylate phosphodiesterase [Bordetella hinzii]KCB24465.1 cyclic diguanylate phosphodiesterase (EAL) domain protein [Bordetella hinzii OH87 BAL007II]KCB26687.1 cyclic diguanylate phosphodiesterase (EAL) domain protein [Bordetella hinzii CA90 BAL1384]
MKQPAVLVIEDHPVQRLVIVRALEMLGYTRILQAPEGYEALEQLKRHGAADIVICDVRTPGMDGTQFLREASQRNLVKSVILSSDVSSDLTAAILHMASLSGIQVLGDLGKPLKLSRLESLLRRYEADAAAAPGHAEAPDHEPPSAEEIRRGLDRGEFIPYYQPKFDVRTLQPAGAEVLARWNHPDRGLLSPSYFIEAVKHCDELDRMTWALADQAMAQTARSVLMGRGASLALNVETCQLGSAQLMTDLIAALERHALPATALTIEVTETGLLSVQAATLETLVRLRLLGCTVSIDDFGTGFSSMERLCNLPFNQLKIDASFVRRLPGDARSESVIAATLSLAESLGITVVAEGIETPDQRNALLDMRCALGQGYWYARPMSGDEYESWLFNPMVANT